MAFKGEDVTKIFNILSHKLRRDILIAISEKKVQSFSNLMHTLDIDTGKLSFHLRKLKLFVDQTPSGQYKLNSLGKQALELIRDAKSLSIEADFLEDKSSRHLAKFSTRALAFLLDMSIVSIITMAATVISEITVLFSGQFINNQNIILFIGLLWLYSTLFEAFSGQTIGKYFLNIKVVSLSRKKVHYDIAAVRNFGKCFLLPADLLYGFIIEDKRFIKFFDKFTRTTVIKQ